MDDLDNLPFALKPPKEIVKELDQYVIGQDRIKRILAVQTFNCMLRYISKDMNNGTASFDKSNILLFGGTGVGKTYIIEKLSQIVDIPSISIDCSQLSKTGYVGGCVSDQLQQLNEKATEKAKLIMEKRSESTDKNSVEVIPDHDGIIDFRDFQKLETKKYWGNRIEQGKIAKQLAKIAIVNLDEIDKLRKQQSNSRDIIGGVQQELLVPLQGAMMDGLDTSNFLFICSGAFADMEEVQDKYESGIGFGADVDGALTEGSYFDITDKSLIEYGLMSELVGRLHIKTHLDKLGEEDFFKILKTSKDSVAKQFVNQMATFKVDIEFTDESLKEIAKHAALSGTGARSLRSIFERVMDDHSYDFPTTLPSEKVVIDVDYVKKKLENTHDPR